MQKLIIIPILIITLAACNKKDSHKNDKIKNAAWLIGTWENNTDQGNLSETWKKVNDSTFSGQAYFIKLEDTLHHENIILEQMGEDLLYIATVEGQNKGKSVTFKLTQATQKQLIFENPKHDYPQKIVYRQITKDSLVAEISGMQQGKPSSEQYPMKRTE